MKPSPNKSSIHQIHEIINKPENKGNYSDPPIKNKL